MVTIPAHGTRPARDGWRARAPLLRMEIGCSELVSGSDGGNGAEVQPAQVTSPEGDEGFNGKSPRRMRSILAS